MTTSKIRIIGLSLSLVFASVGMLFLFTPAAVFKFINAVGRNMKMTEAPLSGAGFYQALAVGYMYVVTVLAWLMFRNPSVSFFSLLLANAKGASGILSFGLFIFHQPYLIYPVNGLVDVLLGILAFYIYRTQRRNAAAPIP